MKKSILLIFAVYTSVFSLSAQEFPFRNEKLLVEQRIFDLVSSIEIPITNRSKISASEVMQLYVQIEKAPFRVPLYDLKNIQRLSFLCQRN